MPQRHASHNALDGFTLIELSIVLIIIGLLVGGILVGKDLINAAELRATISQVEKYQSAVNTFQLKYNCLPGDCLNVTPFGFTPRGQFTGEGDGNGILEGVIANGTGADSGVFQGAGETAVFWVDLSSANLIDGLFNTASETVVPGANITAISQYMPKAKLGRGNYFYVYSSTGQAVITGNGTANIVQAGSAFAVNVLGLSAVTLINEVLGNGEITSNPGLSEIEAYNIDRKLDDGLPLSGKVIANYLNNIQVTCFPGPSCAIAGAPNTCFDNNNNANIQANYSTEISNGTNTNCGLSFWLQP
jgi:prepilin-type N-terminal cleavage/methylation domain-containing protein